MTYRLGRRERIRLPSVPHLSALLAGVDLSPPPPEVDYTRALPPELGVMLNSTLGDCTCAAFGHAVQVWSANAGKMVTLPDSAILSLYEGACGYKPSDPSTDQGGIEQAVLSYLVRSGCGGNKLAAFVEVDVRNLDDVRRAIAWGGVAYIGFNVPRWLMDETAPNSDWDIRPGPDDIVGGHAVVLAAYNERGATVISWGNLYSCTWRFLQKYCDEAYLLADPSWIEATGKTPAGMTLAQLEQQMQAIRQAA